MEDDVACSGSTTPPDAGAGLHPTAAEGLEWLSVHKMPFVPAADMDGVQLRRASADGLCAIHSLSQCWNDRDATEPEAEAFKLRLATGMADWVVGDAENMSELCPESERRLRALGLQEACEERAVGEDNGSQRRGPRTVGWTRRNIANTVRSQWLSIPWLALVAVFSNCNIAVWEPAIGGGIRLYKNQHQVGLFIQKPELMESNTACVHLLYNSNSGGRLENLGAWKVRGREQTAKHNHFDNIQFAGRSPWSSCVAGGETTPAGRTEQGPSKGDVSTKDSGSLGGSRPTAGCKAVMASGQKSGSRCGKPAKSNCGEYCGMHGRATRKRGKNDARRDDLEKGRGDDGEMGGGYSDDGSEASMTGDKADFEDKGSQMADAKNLEKCLASIGEESRRKAFKFVYSMRPDVEVLKDRKERKKARREAQAFLSPDPPVPDSGEGSEGIPPADAANRCRWVNTGMEESEAPVDESEDSCDSDGAGSDGEYAGDGHEYDECHRKKEGKTDSFSPTEETQKRLPQLSDEEDIDKFDVEHMGWLAYLFFSIMFPQVVIDLLVNKTNEYAVFCSTRDYEPKGRTERHKAKRLTLGKSKWPEHGITSAMMLGVLGIVITMGVVKLPEMARHWDTQEYYDYVQVRRCMARDLFSLIYCRFFHMASSGAPKRLKDGTQEDGYDALHHIRGLETLLNATWSGACVVGRWFSFDEQMVLARGRPSKCMQRHMPKKPIKNGIKIWAATCILGYCFVAYCDGGYKGDPMIQQWKDSPLGRTCCMVLFVLFHACPAFAVQLERSGTYMACDNYFTSPILFMCLMWQGVYAVGTLRVLHRGAQEAQQYWTATNQCARKIGEMCHARFGCISFVKWVDSKLVNFLSTIHITPKDFRRVAYSKNKSGGEKEHTWQPKCREDYNVRMGGVDIADQYNSCYLSRHRSNNYFWRRVFEQKLMQATTNAYLLYQWWLTDVSRKVDQAIQRLESELFESPSEEGTERLDALKSAKKGLATLAKKTRLEWLSALSMELMARCEEGNESKGRRRKSGVRTPAASEDPETRILEDLRGKQRLSCECKDCDERKKPTRRGRSPRGKRSRKACRCRLCFTVGGVVLCSDCHNDDKKHDATFNFVVSRTKNGGTRTRPTLLFFGVAPVYDVP